MRNLKTFFLVLGLAAIAAFALETWHSFIWFGARSKRAEAKTNLGKLCHAQKTLLTEGKPSSTWRGLNTELERGNRYAYFVAPGGALELRPDDHRPVTPDPEATGVQVDPRMAPRVTVSEADVPASLLGAVKLGGNGASWVMVAIGDIDIDPELDVLSVSTGPRVTSSGETVDSCVAFLERDDIPPGPIRGLFR